MSRQPARAEGRTWSDDDLNPAAPGIALALLVMLPLWTLLGARWWLS